MSFPYRLYHRVMGLCLALPLLLLVVTGVPLQFTVALNLGSAGVPFQWVHESYGINAPESALASERVMQMDDLLLWPGRWQRVTGDLLGARQFEEVLVVATTDELLLAVADQDVPVERSSLPDSVQQFGTTVDQKFVIRTANGRLLSDDFGVNWRPATHPASELAVTWLSAEGVPVPAELTRRYGEINLSWERWLQDLHTGRFFGGVGVWIMNLASFVFILLGFTGLVLWYTSRRRKST